MIPTSEHAHGLLRELTLEECWHHLCQHDTGRIAYVDQIGPIVVPINYLARSGRIWIRTASYNDLARHLPDQEVAFQIDHFNHYQHTGWSVLARGRTEHAVAEPAGPGEGRLDPAPWPEGTRTMMFCLTPREVSGRRLKHRDVTPLPDEHGADERE